MYFSNGFLGAGGSNLSIIMLGLQLGVGQFKSDSPIITRLPTPNTRVINTGDTRVDNLGNTRVTT